MFRVDGVAIIVAVAVVVITSKQHGGGNHIDRTFSHEYVKKMLSMTTRKTNNSES